MFAIGGVPTPAAANAANPFVYRVEGSAGAYVLGQTPLRVEREQLTFRCRGQRSMPSCRFEARYEVHNPMLEDVRTLGAFYGDGASEVHIRAAGRDARAELSAAQLAAIDGRVRELDEIRAHEESAPAERAGYRLDVAAGERVTVVFEGPVTPYETERATTAYALPAAYTRHVAVSNEPRGGEANRFRYLVSPIRDFAAAPTIEVTIEVEDHLALGHRGLVETTTETRGDLTVVRGTIDPAQEDVLWLSFERDGTLLYSGGPLVGIGPRLDAGDVRFRAGWEIGAPGWLVHSLVFESDFESHVTVVLGTEAATPFILLIPSLAIGAGVPVMFHEGRDPQLGVRLSFALSFPVLSLHVPLDWYPAQEGDHFQAALLVQLSI